MLLVMGIIVVLGVYGWMMGLSSYEIQRNSSIILGLGAGAVMSLSGTLLFFYGLAEHVAESIRSLSKQIRQKPSSKKRAR